MNDSVLVEAADSSWSDAHRALARPRPEERRRVQLAVQLSWAGAAMMGLWVAAELVAGDVANVPLEVAVAVLLVLGPVLARAGRTREARLWTVIAGNLTVLAGVVCFEPGSGGELPFVPLVALPMLLFDRTERLGTLLGAALPVALFAVGVVDARTGFLGLHRLTVPAWSYGANVAGAMVLSFVQAFWLVGQHERAEAELRELGGRRLRAVLDSGLAAVALGDAAGRVREANAAFLELVGASADDLRHGLHYAAFTPPEDRPKVQAALARALAEGTCPPFARSCVRPDGTTVPVITRFARIDPDGDEVVAFSVDVSAQQALDRHERLLAESRLEVKARDELAAVAAHELRTPMAAIGLQLGMIRRMVGRRDDVDPRARALFADAERTIEQLRAVVESLHDVSRLRAGELRLTRAPTDLAALVAHAIAMLEAPFPGCGERIRVVSPEPVVGAWDGVRVEQALTNLLSNALKYGEGGPVEVALSAADGRARAAVRDHGRGLAPERLEHLFRPFERAPEHRGRIEGLGLGLFVVRRIAEAHGGTVSVASTPGEGSEFTLDLPLAPPSGDCLAPTGIDTDRRRD